MEDKIQNFLSSIIYTFHYDGVDYKKITNKISLLKIYYFYFYDIFRDDGTKDELLYYGIYYNVKYNQTSYNILKKIYKKKAKEIYLKAFNKGSMCAILLLAIIYCATKNKMLKYLLLVTDDNYDQLTDPYEQKCRSIAMEYIGGLYGVNGDTENMEKYYLMAYKLGDVDALMQLGCEYKNCNDVDNMKKYWELAVENDSIHAMRLLGDYYREVDNISNMDKYYNIGIKLNDFRSMICYAKYYQSINDNVNAEEYFLMATKINKALAYLYTGRFYKDIGDINKMKVYYLKALELNRRHCSIRINQYLRELEDMEFYDQCYKCSIYAEVLQKYTKLKKKYNYKNVLGDINLQKYTNRYKPTSMGMKIAEIHYNTIDTDIYDDIESSVVDYLGIKNIREIEDRVSSFLND